MHRENLELAGRCGFLQARVMDLENQVKALTPPAEPFVVEEQRRVPWWKR